MTVALVSEIFLAWMKVSRQKLIQVEHKTNHPKFGLKRGLGNGFLDCLLNALLGEKFELVVDSVQHVVSDGVLECEDFLGLGEGQLLDDHTRKA
jgi:hypothetical protein